MNPSQPAQRAIDMLEVQVSDLAGIRNATARDPSFKNWRQATLTVMHRVWPGDQVRSERFRRIPFSPVDPRADLRAVREQYSRGCQEAGRVLTGFINEIREHGVPELSDTAVPHAPESDFEDGFPTLDLPSGDIATQADPVKLAEHLLAGLGDEPPQGKDPDFADPARLPKAPPAAVPAPTMASMVAQGAAKKGPSMKSRLRELLGFANLSAKSLAGPPCEPEPERPAPAAPPVLAAAASDVPADWPVIPRRGSAEASASAEQAPWPVPLAHGDPAPANVAPVAAAPAPVPVQPPPPQAAVAPVPVADPPPVHIGESAPQDSTSVIMSKPTTLRASIEKVSIESLISPEFRAPDAGNQPGAGPEPSPEPGADGPARGKHGSRPALSVVRPLADDPEFNVDPTPSHQLPAPADHSPVPALTPKPARGAAARSRAVTPPAKPPAQPALPPSAAAEPVDDPESDVDPDAFARATEDFMRSSPVLGASPRRSQRTNEDLGFGDPDAIAVSSMALELSRMEVPQERHAEVRARLMDLARRLERGELEWNALRKAVWFAMEHPELARRLMPVLLPWIDRAA